MKQHLLIFATVFLCLTISASAQVKSKQIFTYVEQMPEFTGNMNDYLVSNLKYPKEAKAAKKEGRVVVRFVVDEMGKVQDAQVVKSVDAHLDAEAKRVITAMPNWKPAKQAGKTVPVYFTLPIEFRL